MNVISEGSATRKRSAVRRLALILATSMFVLGIGSVPASADQPFEVNDSVTFPDINPCTGNEMLVTINSTIRVHEHGERFVVHFSKTGTTDDGYVMDHGVENQVFNGNNFRRVFTDNWRDADGSKFKAQGVFVANEDGVLVDNFRLRCVGN